MRTKQRPRYDPLLGTAGPRAPGRLTEPAHPVTREAYSQEVGSAGFWPSGGPLDHAASYTYAYPVPQSFADYPVRPESAYFQRDLGESLLRYDAVRAAKDPDGTLLAFLPGTYKAVAETACCRRTRVEREPVPPI